MKTLDTITSTHWQPSLTQFGGVVEGINDISQAIQIILTTPLGSDPHRPTFGSNINQYLDWPVNRVTPYLVREAIDAIKRWEPRISVIAIYINIADHQITLSVKWTAKDNVLQQTQVIYERTTSPS